MILAGVGAVVSAGSGSVPVVIGGPNFGSVAVSVSAAPSVMSYAVLSATEGVCKVMDWPPKYSAHAVPGSVSPLSTLSSRMASV